MSVPHLCGAHGKHPTNGMQVYCTRPLDHDGEHIASIGPYYPARDDVPETPVITRWPNPPNNGGPADQPRNAPTDR